MNKTGVVTVRWCDKEETVAVATKNHTTLSQQNQNSEAQIFGTCECLQNVAFTPSVSQKSPPGTELLLTPLLISTLHFCVAANAILGSPPSRKGASTTHFTETATEEN